MTKIRKLTDVWAKTTWEEQIAAIGAKPDTKESITAILEKLGILTKKIKGECVEKLPQTVEGRFPKGMNITYTKAFDLALIENPEMLPALYLKHLTEAFDFHRYPLTTYEGLIARGLRTFPSLLRDRDFAENVDRLIVAEGISRDQFKVINGPKQDVKDHTDVLLEFRNKCYRIWLYQFSERGVQNDIERVVGKRGKLPNGTHILCPLISMEAKEIEKLERRKNSFTRSYEKWLSRLSESKGNELQKAKERTEFWKEKLLKNNIALATISASPKEISVYNGWYFYSDKKVQAAFRRVVELSEGTTKPQDYEEVCRVLREPEKFFGEIRSFSKVG